MPRGRGRSGGGGRRSHTHTHTHTHTRTSTSTSTNTRTRTGASRRRPFTSSLSSSTRHKSLSSSRRRGTATSASASVETPEEAARRRVVGVLANKTTAEKTEWWRVAARPNALELQVVQLREQEQGVAVVGFGAYLRHDLDYRTPFDVRLERVGVPTEEAFDVRMAEFERLLYAEEDTQGTRDAATECLLCCPTATYFSTVWGCACVCCLCCWHEQVLDAFGPCRAPACVAYSPKDREQEKRMARVLGPDKAMLEAFLRTNVFPQAASVVLVPGETMYGASRYWRALSTENTAFARTLEGYVGPTPCEESDITMETFAPNKLMSVLVVVRSPRLGAATDPISWVMGVRGADTPVPMPMSTSMSMSMSMPTGPAPPGASASMRRDDRDDAPPVPARVDVDDIDDDVVEATITGVPVARAVPGSDRGIPVAAVAVI